MSDLPPQEHLHLRQQGEETVPHQPLDEDQQQLHPREDEPSPLLVLSGEGGHQSLHIISKCCSVGAMELLDNLAVTGVLGHHILHQAHINAYNHFLQHDVRHTNLRYGQQVPTNTVTLEREGSSYSHMTREDEIMDPFPSMGTSTDDPDQGNTAHCVLICVNTINTWYSKAWPTSSEKAATTMGNNKFQIEFGLFGYKPKDVSSIHHDNKGVLSKHTSITLSLSNTNWEIISIPSAVFCPLPSVLSLQELLPEKVSITTFSMTTQLDSPAFSLSLNIVPMLSTFWVVLSPTVQLISTMQSVSWAFYLLCDSVCTWLPLDHTFQVTPVNLKIEHDTVLVRFSIYLTSSGSLCLSSDNISLSLEAKTGMTPNHSCEDSSVESISLTATPGPVCSLVSTPYPMVKFEHVAASTKVHTDSTALLASPTDRVGCFKEVTVTHRQVSKSENKKLQNVFRRTTTSTLLPPTPRPGSSSTCRR